MTDHRHIEDRLDAYLDGTLSEEEQRQIAAHIEVCPLCSEAFEKARSLVEQAKELPGSIPPRRDLWPAIEAQIRPQRAPAPPAARGVFRTLRPKWAFGVALAAAAVVAVILLSPPEEPGKRHLSEPAAVQPGMPAYISALTRALEYECMGAGKQLLASLGTSGNRLGLEAAAAIEQSVHPIDVAIEETKSALERNPGDPELLQMLTSRYERKLSLLHQAIRLAGEA